MWTCCVAPPQRRRADETTRDSWCPTATLESAPPREGGRGGVRMAGLGGVHWTTWRSGDGMKAGEDSVDMTHPLVCFLSTYDKGEEQ